MIIWISRWYRRDGTITADEAVRDYVEIGINGVVKSAKKAGRR